MVKIAVLVFPGSNCDHDAYHAIKHVLGADVEFVWHKETNLGAVDAVIVPGGFSYGDYLRSGAIARFSPVMNVVVDFAKKGGHVLGICNGFQILLESGLLPGTMLHNDHLKFVCRQVFLRCENHHTPFSDHIQDGKILKIPVAHGEGNYFCDQDTLKSLQDNNQVVFRYCNEVGLITDDANPNGAIFNIAGICNKAGNVLGMMPHPERAVEKRLGSDDGRYILESLLKSLQPA